MMKGTDLARLAGAGVHADIIDGFKEQMLLVLVLQMGGKAVLPVADIDATGGYIMNMQLVRGPEGDAFHFTVEKVQ
jgi:hypothetical protein